MTGSTPYNGRSFGPPDPAVSSPRIDYHQGTYLDEGPAGFPNRSELQTTPSLSRTDGSKALTTSQSPRYLNHVKTGSVESTNETLPGLKKVVVKHTIGNFYNVGDIDKFCSV